MRVERGEVPAGAGGDPATQGGELERLREVAQRQPVLAELVLERGPLGTGLDARRPRDVIHLEHPVEATQVDRHHPGVGVAHPRLDPADHARPAPIRDRRQPLLGAPREHHLDLALVAGMGDQVRRVLDPAPESAHDVAVGPAERVRDALVGVGAEQMGERPWRLDARRRQFDRLERHRLLDLRGPEPELLADPRRRRLELLAGERLVLEPPAPVLAPPGRRAYQ